MKKRVFRKRYEIKEEPKVEVVEPKTKKTKSKVKKG